MDFTRFWCLPVLLMSPVVTATWRWPNHLPLFPAHYPPVHFPMYPAAPVGLVQPSSKFSLHPHPMQMSNGLGLTHGAGHSLSYSIDKFDRDDSNLVWTPSLTKTGSAYLDTNAIQKESREFPTTQSNRPLIEMDRAAMSNGSVHTLAVFQGRTSDALTPSRLMLYEAPPSYDRILLPPPSILVTSRPLPMSAHVGRSPLPIPGHVALLPAANVILRPSVPRQNWSSLATLKTSLLRPDGWTKAAKPARVSEAMRFFLPELKYYSGVKSVDASRVNTTVEKYVLVKNKDPNDIFLPFPVTNNLIVQETLPNYNNPNLYPNELLDRDERKFPNPNIQPQITDLDVLTETSDSHSSDSGTRLSHKSIKDIVAEVFATALPIPEQDVLDMQPDNDTVVLADEGEAEEALKALFDILHLNITLTTVAADMELNDNNSNSRWQKMKQLTPEDVVNATATTTNSVVEIETESHPASFLSNYTVRFEVSPLEPIQTVTSAIETATGGSIFTKVNSIIDLLPTSPVTEIPSTTSPPNVNRCQGLWCYHNAALTSDATVAPTTAKTELQTNIQNVASGAQTNNGDKNTNHIDPLLSYLGLAWPQFVPDTTTTTTTTTTTSPTRKPVSAMKERDPKLDSHRFSKTLTTLLSSTAAPVTDAKGSSSDDAKSKKTNEYKKSGSKNGSLGGRHSLVHSIGQPEELLGLPNKSHETPLKKFSRKEVASMVGALGHGIRQVMDIVMPLIDMGAPPPRMEFNSFKTKSK